MLLILSASVLGFLLPFGQAECIDGKDNVIRTGDGTPDLPIQLSDAVLLTYDKNMQPSCSRKDGGSVEGNGFLKVLSGTLIVNKEMNISGEGQPLWTFRKNDLFFGYLCQDGVPTSYFMPDADCKLAICPRHDTQPLCDALSTVGKYDCKDLYGNDGLIQLPDFDNVVAAILKGEWRGELKMMYNDELVMHLKIPIDNGWVYLD
ncbi:hypothetical protein M3Y94_01069900 [Aphelenchoides besseyi]|nr:hypothetical protein M3Y94_01069900 [Aphelenchoides besseyi]KAI6216261.1 Parasitic stage specific protein 1 [Aphelenchoides besseyi]